MASRVPVPSPFANNPSVLTLVIGSGPSARHIGLKPWAAGTAAALGVALLGWYLIATLYLVFKDDMFSRLISQQTEMQQAYEDRLADLRNQIDRVTSRQLVDQTSIDARIEELIARHAQLEARHSVVAVLAGQSGSLQAPQRSAVRPGQRAAADDAPAHVGSTPAYAAAPRPLDLTFDLRLPDRPSRLEERAERAPSGAAALQGLPPGVVIAEVADRAERIARQQFEALGAIEGGARQRAQAFSAILGATGLDAARFGRPAPKAEAAQGGPLVPLAAQGVSGEFETRLNAARGALSQSESLRRILQGLPLRRPLPPEHGVTSGFGARTDPFTRALAMHTGVDFRAPTGAPVTATAAGKVIEAGWVGGYGNMVELDHGHGVTTRYAHLSSIAVEVGDTVARGDLVGRVGSTGRSTGPHLHYETRIDGEPADPMRFLRAGEMTARP